MKVKELTPNPLAMMESTRSIGYSTETAIADILDNSIAANAKNIDIFYSPAANKPYIAIVDDGCGMSSKELDIAMTYGGHSPLLPRQKEDLGRFGLGLLVGIHIDAEIQIGDAGDGAGEAAAAAVALGGGQNGPRALGGIVNFRRFPVGEDADIMARLPESGGGVVVLDRIQRAHLIGIEHAAGHFAFEIDIGAAGRENELRADDASLIGLLAGGGDAVAALGIGEENASAAALRGKVNGALNGLRVVVNAVALRTEIEYVDAESAHEKSSFHWGISIAIILADGQNFGNHLAHSFVEMYPALC